MIADTIRRLALVAIAALAVTLVASPADATPDEWRRHGDKELGATFELPADWTLRAHDDLGPRARLRGFTGESADGRARVLVARVPRNDPARSLEEALESFKECFLRATDLERVSAQTQHGARALHCPDAHGPIGGLDARFRLVVIALPAGKGWLGVFVAGERDEFAAIDDTARRIVESVKPAGRRIV